MNLPYFKIVGNERQHVLVSEENYNVLYRRPPSYF